MKALSGKALGRIPERHGKWGLTPFSIFWRRPRREAAGGVWPFFVARL